MRASVYVYLMQRINCRDGPYTYRRDDADDPILRRIRERRKGGFGGYVEYRSLSLLTARFIYRGVLYSGAGNIARLLILLAVRIPICVYVAALLWRSTASA